MIAYFAGNPIAGHLLMALLIVGGIIAGLNLNIRSLPELDLRTISITMASPGSSPGEIEEDIIRRIEESVVGLPGVARVVSTASSGIARVEVELETFANEDAVLADVKNAVDSIERFPPASAEHQTIEIKKISGEVMTLSVSSSVLSEHALRQVAEGIRDELLALPAVSVVRLNGTRAREISIQINEEELRHYNLTMSRVATELRRASVNLTLGELRTDSGGVVLHSFGKKENAEDFENIPLITRDDGTIVRLGDVATLTDGFVGDDILSEVDGKPTVFVRVEASRTQSLVDIAEGVEGWLAGYQSPLGTEVAVWSNRVEPVFDRFSEIIRNGAIGAILVLVCLILFFDLRIAFWVTIGIPLSFVGSLMFFDSADLTLNMGTMFAFFLLIGIVVDDAVVVGESVASEREKGKRGPDAALAGVRAVAGPIAVGVLTTVIAFVPFLFVTAGNYQLVQVFPYVAMFVLFVSLIEAFLILPSHLSHDRPWSLEPLRDIQEWFRQRFSEFRDAVVLPAVSWSIRHVFLTFALGFVFILAALWLVRSENVPVIIFDKMALFGNTIQADIALPVGAPFGDTVATARRFAEAASEINGQFEGTAIKSISIIAGNPGNLGSSRTGEDVSIRSHLASVRLQLHERPFRKASPDEIEQLWRQAVGTMPNLDSVTFLTTRFRAKPSVAYALIHDDPQTLAAAAGELREYMSAIPGLYDLSDSLSPGKRHLGFALTPEGEAAGLTPLMVGKQLRSHFHGLEVQRIQRGRDEIRVVVRYPADQRRSVADLADERIVLPNGREIPLATVADITETRELAARIRIDGKQAALVSAYTEFSTITPIQARRTIANDFLPGLVSKYPGLTISRDAGARDEQDMLETLGTLVPIVLIVMYGLMASFLRSYWKPLVAVIGIPMAFAGAVFGHWLLGWHLTAISLFGMIGVAGVIVNDMALLLHRYNVIRRENVALPAIAAASAATRDRFRAVFLTTLTTVLGLSPLLYERSDELLFLVPFVVSMLGGLIAAGIFTLFVLPALVMLVEGRREA